MSDVTQVLAAIDQGDPAAAEQLLPLVYDELRSLAAAKLRHEQPGQTLQATALVHEAFVRLLTPQNLTNWANRRHFFAAAAEAMRRILIENARRKQREKHGGGLVRAELHDELIAIAPLDVDILALNEAFEQFAVEEPQKAELVKLRFFAGLDEQETAELLGISRATAARYWAYAKAWLFERLQK